MGSTGSGRFEHYREDDDLEQGEGGGSSTVKSTTNCPDLIENVRLEDVALSQYYSVNSVLPHNNEVLLVRETTYHGRLVATNNKNEVIGNIPTEYNFLLNCIERGKNYLGKVISSGETPVPFVVVNLYAK